MESERLYELTPMWGKDKGKVVFTGTMLECKNYRHTYAVPMTIQVVRNV